MLNQNLLQQDAIISFFIAILANAKRIYFSNYVNISLLRFFFMFVTVVAKGNKAINKNPDWTC